MKTHAIYFGILLIVLLASGSILLALKRANIALDHKDSIIAEKDTIIHYRTNQYNQVVAEKNAAVATTKEIAKAYPLVVEELKKEFDIKLRDMRAYVRNEFVAQGHGNSTINNHYYTDSLGNQHTSWTLRASDGYLDFRANVMDSLNAPYQYHYGDTATTVFHGKKTWFLGNEKMYSSTRFRNPNSRVVNATNILVDNYRDRRWVLGVGISYLPLMYKERWTMQVQPSVTFSYALLKF